MSINNQPNTSNQTISNQTVQSILGDQGLFAQANPRFTARAEQQTMACAVNDAINHKQHLIVEAGTGVGKTFAYLIPALLSGKQLVVSTGTKNLQNQLFKRDIPNVLKVLGISPQVALLKGRNNYLCEYRLENTLAAGRLPDPVAVKHLGLVNRWKDKTLSGDLGELSPLPENSPVLPYVTSSAENCLGQDCPFIDSCFVAAAREKARKARVLVVNHHLLLADLVLKEDGFGELLPDTDIFLIDEAHHLPKIAYQFYGQSLTSRQLTDLCRELELEYRTSVTDCRDLMLSAQRLAKSVKDFRLVLPEYDTRQDWLPSGIQLAEFQSLSNQINELFDVVKVNSSRTKVLESCFERLMQVKHTLAQLTPAGSLSSNQSGKAHDKINWYETVKSGFMLHTTPLDVASLFQQSRQQYPGSVWIMTSATLNVDQCFDHYIKALGWSDQAHDGSDKESSSSSAAKSEAESANYSCKTLLLDSSFDYYHQSLLYLPRGLPHTNEPSHPKALIDAVLPLIHQSEGRCFILFTSHRALQTGAEYLQELSDFNFLVQGSASKDELLARFVKQANSVLLATGSFWEGVDVVGDDLVLVVIDKLPFAPPDDPILSAKIRQCRQQGGNPFAELQIPEAVLALKQGCGRLIRSVTDKGIVVIGDTRLMSKSYGQVFINSLPGMKRTRELNDALSFLSQHL